MTFAVALSILILVMFNRSTLLRIERRLERDVDRPDTLPFRKPAALIAFLLLGVACDGAEPRTAPPVQAMHIQAPVRSWYRNQADGCCVQMAIGMCGCNCNDINAACLPFDSTFGHAERGGSLPSRVSHYCDARGIKAFNVTGASIDDTKPWIDWAGRTGRFAAMGFTEAHFQTLYGIDPDRHVYYVCDNNSPTRIDQYPENVFREKHRQCMPWCVILATPTSPPPLIVKW